MGDNGDTNLSEWGESEVGQGLLEDAGKSLLGYGLSAMGIGFPDASDSALASLQSELNLIKTQLGRLQSELDQVKTQIAKVEYDTRYAVISLVLSNISSLSQQLAAVATQKAGNPTLDLSAETTLIKSLILSSLLDNQSLISLQVLGPAGGDSLYEVCSSVCKDDHRFLSKADSDLVQSQIDYYQSMQFSQLMLMVNYYHTIANSDALVTEAISNYKTNIANEKVFHVDAVAPGVVVDQQSGLMFYFADCPFVDFFSAFPILAAMDAKFAGDGVGWRLPTVAELIGNNGTKGIFSGYDSQNGKVTPRNGSRITECRKI